MDGVLPATASPFDRMASLIQARRLTFELLAIAFAIAIFLVSVLPNLANHPVPTDDEIWVMSAAYKLATEGVFGSDMFAGFFNADGHYYFNMPGHHFTVAAAFKLFGAGIAQARLVGVIYGVATLLLSYLLARRIYGVLPALLTLALLLFLRLNMGFDTGLPLQELATNMRYDLAPVPFILGGVLLLLGRPGLWRAVAAGTLFGIAVLMQFYAAFILPIAALFLWLEAPPLRQRLQLIGGLATAAAVVGLPYGVYILSNYDDFKGQAGTIDRRADFHLPSFYTDNLTREPDRFLRPLAFKEVPRGADHELVDPQFLSLQETLTRRPSAKLAVLAGLPLALGYFGWRALKENSRPDRLLLLCLGGLVAQYVLFESAKFYIYWIPVMPFLCIGIAAASVWLLRRALSDGLAGWTRTLVRAAGVATGMALLIVFAEGSVARVGGVRAAPDATEYSRLAAAIQEHVPAGSRVVGSTSMWWGLRDTEFRSYFLFFYLTRPDAGPYKTTISGFLEDFDPDYIVLTRLATGELEKYLIPPDYADLQSYLAANATKVTRIEGPIVIRAYGFIDIWRVH
jgi:4-amino-4-deoxy-L-arabinose transferase-like glycosyltransferase